MERLQIDDRPVHGGRRVDWQAGEVRPPRIIETGSGYPHPVLTKLYRYPQSQRAPVDLTASSSTATMPPR